MTESRRGFPMHLALGCIALVVGGILLAAAYFPISECRVCGGTGQVISFMYRPGREVSCDACQRRGKVSLLGKWRQNRDIVMAPPPPR